MHIPEMSFPERCANLGRGKRRSTCFDWNPFWKSESFSWETVILGPVFPIAHVLVAFCLFSNSPCIYLEKLSQGACEVKQIILQIRNKNQKKKRNREEPPPPPFSPLTWESMWIGRPSFKALRTENVHSVVQSRPFLK